jgi:hypothetical protein
VTRSTEAALPAVPPSADRPVWHTLNADQVLSIQAVSEPDGLSVAEVAVVDDGRARPLAPRTGDAEATGLCQVLGQGRK